MTRTLVSSGSRMEPVIGFSRAVRVGPYIKVGGTAAMDAKGKTIGIGDVEAQAERCFVIIAAALEAAGADMADIVQTRILLTNIDDWEKVAAIHGRIFSETRPVCTVMQVSRFVDPDWLVEIEAEAITDAASL